MENCVFCKIMNGEIPSATLYEDDEFKVILDRFPSSVGHVLILPKSHYQTIFEIPAETCGRLFMLATEIAHAMQKTLPFSGLNLLQNNGEDAGQTVPHFHLHLIPRYPKDTVAVHWPAMEPSQEEIDQMCAKIKSNL